MGSDAIASGSAASSAAVAAREAEKKKLGNRSAKLKQCKMDCRREQWLTHGKGRKDIKVIDKKGVGSTMLASSNIRAPTGRSHTTRLDEIDAKGNEHGASKVGSLEGHNPVLNRSPILLQSNGMSKSNGMSSETSAWSSSGSVSGTEEEGGGSRDGESSVLDDWEAVADALSSENGHDHRHIGPSVTHVCGTGKSTAPINLPPSVPTGTQPEPIQIKCRAWSPDDVFRPRSLPSISRQVSLRGGTEVRWGGPDSSQNTLSSPPSCPICYEDLDTTDSSFLPCPCGLHLCLFCHKRIIEADGRCPGCRKHYESIAVQGADGGGRDAGSLAMRLSRSCSMGPRY